jgi:hypothetical protein
MKQAYEKYRGDYGWDLRPIELTGVCKKVTGGPLDRERHYYQAKRRIFGIPLWTYWIHEDCIRFFDPVVETVYECKCGEKYETNS